MVQGFKLEAGAGGSLLAQLAFDGKAKLIGTLSSSLNPKGLALIFGPGAGPFWKSIDFATPPKIEAKVTGASLTENLWRVEGQGVVVEHCQLWQALWMWHIHCDRQQENSGKRNLQSNAVDVPPEVGSTNPVS